MPESSAALDDRLPRHGDGDGGDGERGQQPVEPERAAAVGQPAAHEQHHGQVRGRVEGEPEDVGDGRDGAVGAAERGGHVAARPREHAAGGDGPGEAVARRARGAERGEHAAHRHQRRVEDGLGEGGDGVATERRRERLHEVERPGLAMPASASRRTLRPPSGAIHLIASLLP